MKKSEMVEHILEELIEFIKNYNNASEKRKPHVLKAAAEGILAFQEGFGMQPPPIIDLPDTYNRSEGCYGFEVNEWEEENESDT